MDTKSWIEIAATILLVLVPLLVIGQRLCSGKGIGARVVQFVAVCLIVPVILIFGLEGTVDGSAIAALLGAIVGYVLSDVGRFENRGRGNADD